MTRLIDYASALNAQAEVTNEIVTLVAANAGSLHATINPAGTASTTIGPSRKPRSGRQG